MHAGETVRITVRNSETTFYATTNGDEFLPFHTLGGMRDIVFEEVKVTGTEFQPYFAGFLPPGTCLNTFATAIGERLFP